MRVFYVYLWLREDGTPYYVGKGTGYDSESMRGRYRAYSPFHNVQRPKDFGRIIIQNYQTEEEALLVEKFFIDLYGRLDLGTGCLRNFTNGGEGQSGRLVPKEQREKQAKSLLGRKASESTRMKLKKAANSGRFLTGRDVPKSIKSKISESLKEFYKDPINKLLQGNRNRKYQTAEEKLAAIKESRRKANAKYRAKHAGDQSK